MSAIQNHIVICSVAILLTSSDIIFVFAKWFFML